MAKPEPEKGLYKILAIEDDMVMRKLLHKTMTSEGFECSLAATAAAGISACAQEKPDLVLLDVHLPDDNGIEGCRKLKADEQLRHIPVLILTGEAFTVENRIEGLEAGADDYILKPFSPKELISRIRGILKASTKPSI